MQKEDTIECLRVAGVGAMYANKIPPSMKKWMTIFQKSQTIKKVSSLHQLTNKK